MKCKNNTEECRLSRRRVSSLNHTGNTMNMTKKLVHTECLSRGFLNISLFDAGLLLLGSFFSWDIPTEPKQRVSSQTGSALVCIVFDPCMVTESMQLHKYYMLEFLGIKVLQFKMIWIKTLTLLWFKWCGANKISLQMILILWPSSNAGSADKTKFISFSS